MKSFFLILLIYSFSSFALVEKGVYQPESLFVNQQTPVWCWAAMSEGLRKFYNFPYKSQQSIVDANPFRDTRDVFGYMGSPSLVEHPEDHDYLLDEVLSDERYEAKVERFSNQRVQSLLEQGRPVMLSFAGHVTMIYSYMSLSRETYYKIYDPGAHLLFKYPIYYQSQYNFENMFGEPQAYITYLEPRS